jgi:hypothetical protein
MTLELYRLPHALVRAQHHCISQKACGGGATVELAGFRIISTQNHVDRTTKSVQPT